jgi:type IV secretion system protein VirB8
MSDTKKVSASEEKIHYRKGSEWEADTLAKLEKSERRAWTVATSAGVLALAAVIGLSTLAPFRRNIPYVMTIDQKTGNIEVVEAANDRKVVGYQELLDKHWAQKYVVARESYYYRLLQQDYDEVLNLSTDDVGKEFAKLYEGDQARDKTYGTDTEMKVTIISVQRNVTSSGSNAVVRFSKTTRRINSIPEKPKYFVATIAYDYKPSMFGKEEDLIKNPLGYKVSAYRADGEMAPVLTPEAPVVPVAPVAVAAPAAVPMSGYAAAGPVVPAIAQNAR